MIRYAFSDLIYRPRLVMPIISLELKGVLQAVNDIRRKFELEKLDIVNQEKQKVWNTTSY